MPASSSMARLIQAYDWSATPLGPLHDWPPTLRATVATILSSPVAIVLLCGLDGVMIYNDAYSVFAGGRHPRLLGSKVLEGWPEVAEFNERVMRVGLGGGTLSFRDQQLELHRHGYAEDVWMDLSYGPIRDEHGTPVGVLAIVVETTERVKSERRLRMLRDLGTRTADSRTVDAAFRGAMAALESNAHDLPFAIAYRLDADARAAQRVACTGLDGHEALAPEVLGLDDPQSPWPIAAAIRSGPVLVSLSTLHAPGRRTGGLRDAQAALVLPIRAPDGRSTEARGVLVAGLGARQPLTDDYRAFVADVAERIAGAIATAEAHELDRRRADELEALDRAKTAFFSNVSHEFRTPLTLMLGPLEEALVASTASPQLHDQVARAHRNALRLQRLVNSLLEFSRIEAGRTRATFESTDLAALTRDLASTFRATVERGGLEYVVDCDPLDAPARVDRGMWERVVLNLLSNAFKFTLEGRIHVTLRRDGTEAVLAVADTGAGIPAAELPRLFDRFHRVEGTRGRSVEGSGIGLALVHELVKLHGGRIDVESTPGVGSTFRVRVPLSEADASQPPGGTDRPTASASSSPLARAYAEEARSWLPVTDDAAVRHDAHEVGRADGRFAATFGARIVVADDNLDLLTYLHGLLSPCYAIEAVRDGRAALDAIRRDPPALVVTDVMMPEMDGLQLLAALRSERWSQRIPVLMLSARAGEESRIEGLDAGADDYLVKPFSARELLARVGALLERDLVRRAGENRLMRAFQAAPAFIAILEGPEHRYVFVNDALNQLFGHRSALGRTVREAFPELAGQGIFELLDRVHATGERYVAEEARLWFDATADTPARELYLDFIYEPLRDERNRVTGIFVQGTDATARHRATEGLKAADRQKDEFLAMLAHELRNPLAPIRSASDLLARVVTKDTRAHAAVEILRRQVAQLTRMVDDLLDVSRITQGRIALQRRTVALAQVVEDGAAALLPLAREKDQTISLDVRDRELFVDGDGARLLQCVVNVLANAVKYSDRGTTVRMRLEREGRFGLIEVADEGCGIPADLLPHIFDLFVQSAQSLDRAHGGLGIGLAIVRRLVEMHGGRVSATSEGPQRGATFRIELPLVEQRQHEAHADAGPGRARSRRVLVVDDNVDAASSLAMALRLDGHVVYTAHSGHEALERLEEYGPDVVLLDIGLPGMDGYEVARRIGEHPTLGSVRLIALTGYGQAEDRDRARRSGFAVHLVKPVEYDELLRALDESAS